MASIKTGAAIGSLFGPEGEVIGAGVAGLAGLATAISHALRDPPSEPHERQSLIRPNGLSGREVPGLRQRNVPRIIDPNISRDPNTPPQPRPVRPVRMPRPSTGTIAKVAAAGVATAATSAGLLSTQVPGGTTLPQTTTPGTTTPGTTTVPPPVQNPTTSTTISTPAKQGKDEPKPNPNPITRLPPPVVGYPRGNYRLPAYGRFNFVTWDRYTMGNALGSLS